MCLDFELWKNAITNPKETFKKEEKKANIGEGVKQIGIAGLITGAIVGIAAMVGLSYAGSVLGIPGMTAGTGLGVVALLSSIIMTPIFMVIYWILGSGIIYIFSMIFGGKGSFTKQSYLIAIYYAPIMVITSILGIIPVLGPIIGFIVALYSLYLLTMALKQAHKVSTGKAVAIWLVPMIVVMVIVAIFSAVLFSSVMSTVPFMAENLPAQMPTM